MSEPTATDSDVTDSDATDSDVTEAESDDRLATTDVREYLLKFALVFFAGLAVLATVGVYTSATAAIRAWVAPEYRPVFRAAFNLVVLLLAGLGLSLVVRRLR